MNNQVYNPQSPRMAIRGLFLTVLSCAPWAFASSGAPAYVNGRPLDPKRFRKVLMAASGLRVARQLASLEVVRQEGVKRNVKITPADIQAETDRAVRTLAAKSPNVPAEKILAAVLAERGISRAEFDVGMERNAWLRALIDPIPASSESDLRELFGSIYGEKIRIRHILTLNMAELKTIQDRLTAGEPFEEVARTASRDRVSAVRGGLLPPIGRLDRRFPKVFRDVAFSLKASQVSDPIQTRKRYSIVKLLERIPPKNRTFAAEKPKLARLAREQMQRAAMRKLMTRLMKQAKIEFVDPILKAQTLSPR